VTPGKDRKFKQPKGEPKMQDSKLQIRNVEVNGFGPFDHVVMKELGDRVVLEGVNGVGKTMILNAIRAGLEGKAGLPDRPLSEFIKNGHESAIIKLDLAGGSTIRFSIRVIITANDFDLQIKEIAEDGKAKKIPGGPMAFLKTIVNAIAFRPQQWRKKNDAEQLEEVFNFFPGLKEKLSDNSKKISEAEQERARLLNRSKVLRLDIDRAPFAPNLPEKEIDPKELFDKLKVAQEHNKELEVIQKDMQAALDDIFDIDERVKSIEKEHKNKMEMILALQEQLKQSEAEIKGKFTAKNSLLDSVNHCKIKIEHFDKKDLEPINIEISTINEKNKSIRQNADRKKKQEELEKAELDASVAYKKIAALNKDRSSIMATAEIPIDGLSIGDGCLLYPNSNMDMVRLSALSDGEFWPVACGLVAAFNPRVRIVIIDNMHDLDKKNFELLCTSAKIYGMQVWIHKTLFEEKDAGAGFLIRDGQIVGNYEHHHSDAA
jgi:hypothetical protein